MTRTEFHILPKLALRRRSADHPLAMFATCAAVALSTMAFSATTGVGPVARVEAPVFGKVDAKTSRLPVSTSQAGECNGVAWGAETSDCLRAIALQNGRKAPREIRIIAAAEVDHQRPNVF